MDQCLADVTGLAGLKTGDEVLLFGGPELPAEEVAALLGTINYEVVCLVGRRVPRIYL
jgi:alanine racemase